MACAACHRGTASETWAGIPSLDDCLSCHAFDPPGRAASDDVGRLRAAAREGRPSGWGGLYRLAPHARFSHRAHEHARLACAECHGETGRAPVSRRENPRLGEELMDWCLDCHARKQASTECLACHL